MEAIHARKRAQTAPGGDDQERPEPSLRRSAHRGPSGGAGFGCALTHAVPEKPDDVDEQHALLRRAMPSGPTPSSLRQPMPPVQWGIRILCFVSRPDAFKPTCFVGSDDGHWARASPTHLFDRLEGGGRVVSLEGHPDAITTAARAKGFPTAAAERQDRGPAEILLPVEVVGRANCGPGTCPTRNARSRTGRSTCVAKMAFTATPELEIVAAHNFPLRRTTPLGSLWAASRLRGECLENEHDLGCAG